VPVISTVPGMLISGALKGRQSALQRFIVCSVMKKVSAKSLGGGSERSTDPAHPSDADHLPW